MNRRPINERREHLLFAFGVVPILTGLLLNEYVRARVVAGDGTFRPGGAKTAIWMARSDP